MRKILSLLSVALVLTGCTDIQSPQLEPGGLSLSRGPANAPFLALSLSATERHTCAIVPGRDLYCWGSNDAAQLGLGSTSGIVTGPARVGGVNLVEVSVGGVHSCGLDAAGVAYCWGANRTGALGNGTTGSSEVPQLVDTEIRFKSIGAGNQFTCALTDAGAAHCWGINNSGALGAETTELCVQPNGAAIACSKRPVAVSGGHIFVDLQVGLWNGCGLTAGGSAFCWGNNNWGQLGVGSYGPFRNTAPRAVSGGVQFTQLSVGAVHMCGLSAGGVTYCWGYNAYGQLGNGTKTDALAPRVVEAGGRIFAAVVAGDGNTILGHSCATEADGSLYCWGANSHGQLGTTSELPACGTRFVSSCSSLPLLVETELKFAAFDLGSVYSCAISDTKRAYCWGSNEHGALGNADVETSTSAVTPVAGAARGRAPATPPGRSRAFQITDL